MTANNTKERIVELGRDFVQLVGYHSFKYQQIATELGIKNAAIHHYFPAKEDLGVAILEKDMADFVAGTKYYATASPRQKLEMVLDIYDRYCKEGKKLCILGSCGASFQEIPERMQQVAKVYMEIFVGWVRKAMQEGLDTGEFTFHGSAEEMVARWTATLPGSLQVARLRGSEYFKEILTLLRADLNP